MHEFKCESNGNICNSRQKWNHNSVGVSLNNYMIAVLAKIVACEILVNVLGACECSKICKIDEILDIKNCSSNKCLIGKLVLECENKTLNRTETSIDDKKVITKK